MKINLRDFYPHIAHDCFGEAPDDIAHLLKEYKTNDESYAPKMRDKKPLSLDFGDKKKSEVLIIYDISPEKFYEKKITIEQLHEAINKLT